MIFKTWNIRQQKAIIPEKLEAKEVSLLTALLTVKEGASAVAQGGQLKRQVAKCLS